MLKSISNNTECILNETLKYFGAPWMHIDITTIYTHNLQRNGYSKNAADTQVDCMV